MSQSTKVPILSFSFTAGSDFSPTSGGPGPLSSRQYTAVKLDSSTQYQVLTAGAGDPAIGVNQGQSPAGGAVETMILGISQLIVDGSGTAIAPGDKLKVDGSGRGIKTTSAGDQIFARALQPSTAQNDQIAVVLYGSQTL